MEKEYETELEKRDVLRLNNQESNRLTKECLTLALIYLMNEKPYDKITITELVKRSGVSRTAFYRNYSSKDDILSELGKEVTSILCGILENPEYNNDLYGMFLECFNAIRDNHEIIELMISADIPFNTVFTNGSVISYRYPADSPLESYCRIAAESALYAMIISWLKGGMSETADEMAGISVKIFDGIEKTIKR